MKLWIKYLLVTALFTMAGTFVHFHAVTGQMRGYYQSESSVADLHGEITDHVPGEFPAGLLTPASNPLDNALQRRVQHTGPQFFPAVSYLSHHSFRDFKDNYRQIFSRQSSCDRFSDLSLEYVFRLRRILI